MSSINSAKIPYRLMFPRLLLRVSHQFLFLHIVQGAAVSIPRAHASSRRRREDACRLCDASRHRSCNAAGKIWLPRFFAWMIPVTPISRVSRNINIEHSTEETATKNINSGLSWLVMVTPESLKH
jgi:hypothetical protein